LDAVDNTGVERTDPIAATVGVHHSAVKRVLDAADADRQRDLLAAS
jgi:hypothetical protein